MTRKLHIGGRVPAPGWEILDAVEGPHVDHLGNANDLSRFADGTFEALYASHVLEHFDYKDELGETLREWWRVLQPGGFLYVSVPDLEVLARLFIDRERLSQQERFQVMRMMFGGHMDDYDYHKVGLDQDLLANYLFAAGFTNLWKMERFGLFEDTSELQVKGQPISLNIRAERPRGD